MTYASGRPVIEPLSISVYGGEYFVMDILAFLILAVMVYQTRLYRNRGRKEDRMFFYMLICLMIAAVFDAAEYGTGFLLHSRDNVISETFSLISFIFLRAVPGILVFYFSYRHFRDEERLKIKVMQAALLAAVSDTLLIISFFIFVSKGELGNNVGHGPETVIFFAGIFISLIYEVKIIRLLFLYDRQLLPFMLLILLVVIIFMMPVGVMLYTIMLVFVQIDEMNRGFYEREGGLS